MREPIRRTGVAALGALLVAVSWTPAKSHARTEELLDYSYKQIWSAAVRLVRVDYGFPLRDKDPEVGYVLFDYEKGDRGYPGGMEIVRVRKAKRQRIRVVVKIPAMPSYVEHMVLDKLKEKLRKTLGEPITPPRRERDGASDDETKGGNDESDDEQEHDEDEGDDEQEGKKDEDGEGESGD